MTVILVVIGALCLAVAAALIYLLAAVTIGRFIRHGHGPDIEALIDATREDRNHAEEVCLDTSCPIHSETRQP
jgi:hypothetical protein